MHSPVQSSRSGFTIIELMAATVIFVILLGLIFTAINEVGKTWKSANNKIESFQNARIAFERMTRSISQATLNTHYDYFDSNGNAAGSPSYNQIPSTYGRQSDLHFISGKSLVTGQYGHALFFQVPAGRAGTSYQPLHNLLNACGYFVRFDNDSSTRSLSGRPPFLTGPPRYHYQLVEYTELSENLSVYTTSGVQWFTNPLSSSPAPVRILAENIVTLIVHPLQPEWEESSLPANERIGAEYEYNTRIAWTGGVQPPSSNQLCPLLKMILIAIDEDSALRLQGNSSLPPDLGFDPNSLFQVAENLQSDLRTAENAMRAKGINYRIFQTVIALPNSKWL